MGVWWRWALVSLDGVAPSWTVGVSASVNLPWHHKVQEFSSCTSSPGWSRKKGRKVVVCVCVLNTDYCYYNRFMAIFSGTTQGELVPEKNFWTL